MNSVLVLCEANICRSPMAEALLRARLPGMDVRSAGLHAWSGMRADESAIRLMAERGIDIEGHRALQVTRELCTQAELIFVMSLDQRARVEEKYPFSRGRVFRLCEFTKLDVPDPYRRGADAFSRSLQLIEEGVRDWLTRIHMF